MTVKAQRSLKRLILRIGIEIKQLARSILNSCFIRHAEGESMIVKAADYGRFLREAVKATGYITIYREEFDGTLLISKGHMFKTLPDINGVDEKLTNLKHIVEHNYWTLNGQVLLDGNRNLDAYRYEEEIL